MTPQDPLFSDAGGRASRAHLSVRELALTWRRRAQEMRRFGALPNAASFEVAADELEAALRDENDQPLTLGQAAAESGYSEDHLGRELRLGRIPNAGKRHAPRIRRADLPRKPRHSSARPFGEYDPVADARSLLADRLQSNGGGQ